MNSNKQKILLLGCGYTLSKVAEKLPRNQFVAVVRSEKNYLKLKNLGAQVEICDLRISDQVNRLFSTYPEAQIIIDSTPPDEKEPALIAKNISEKINSDNKIKKLIYLSSTGVYNSKDGSWINEKSATTSHYQKGLNRLVVEDIYSQLSISSVCLRISAIYGPARGTGYNIKHGKSMNLFSKERWTNRIHVEDLAHIIVTLINNESDSNFPKTLNCSDDFPSQVIDLIEHYAKVLNLETAFVESLLIQKDPSRARESSQRIDNRLLKDTLKYEFIYPSFKDAHKSAQDIQ